MEAYQQLLQQFHSQQVTTIEENTHLQYMQLFNQVKTSKDKKNQKKNKILFQATRLKTQISDFMRHSSLQKSLKKSRISTINDNFKQKMSLVELQRQSLLQQIDDLNTAYDKLRKQKSFIKQEIQMFDKKEVQISSALYESISNAEEINRAIKEQKLSNDRQFQQFDMKIEQMTLKLQSINEQNILNSKQYKEISTTNTQNQNNTLLGSILMWQNEQNKIKKIPKKIYKKNQIESMLRALFLIIKFSELNFGNIIQHLIKLADPDNEINQERKSRKKIYLDHNGQEIEVKQLINILQKQLLTVNESKFLSKAKILQFYARKGIVISSNWENGQLSEQTVNMIEKVLQHYEKLTSWFSRIEKRNVQLSQYIQSLQKIDEQLSTQIMSIENSAAEKSINYLQLRELQIQHLNQRLNETCKIIFQFNINVYDLVKRFQNLNKFFDKIVKSTNRRTYKKTFIQFQEDTNFLKKITKGLFKSPQCIIMDWNNVIKSTKTQNLFRKTGQGFETISDNQIYFDTIMKNDLLRIYAEPSMYETQKSYIDNLQITFEYVIGEQAQIIKKLSHILKDLFMFSKDGIKQFEEYKAPPPPQRKRISYVNDKEAQDKLNPLLKLLQQSNSQFAFDKFFHKDEIKQEEKPTQQENFCVQSNDYYRRDNFKLIQKLQKLNLKKRGLLPSVPFFVNTSLELEPNSITIDSIQTSKQTYRLGSTRNSYRRSQPRLSHQLLSTRHNKLSELREKQSSRKKDLKLLLNNISNIASQNQKYRIKKKINMQQFSLSASTSRIRMNTTKIS